MMHRQLLRKSLLLRRPSLACSPRCPPGIYRQSLSPLLLNIAKAKANNATHHHHDTVFNCSQSAPFSTDSSISTSGGGGGKEGIVSRIKRVIRTIFGSNDDTPRGIQERKDMYWILLAMSHRNLRMEAQQQQQHHHQNQQMMVTTKSWNKETKEQIKQYMDDAITYLDTQTDIDDMSLRQLRTEVQKRLQPQIEHLLNVACNVESEMMMCHNTSVVDNNNMGQGDENNVDDDTDTDDNYEFSEVEAIEYKEILLQEYDHVNKQIQLLAANDDDDDAIIKSPDYYHLKKGAIETLLRYFDWMPLPNTTADSSQATHSNNIEHEEEDYIDEFGFYPNRSEEDIVSAMRYYHVRNIVRSHRVRTSLDININKEESDRDGGFGGGCTYSILPFKSTIPNAGRGVFIDGFAPAGTLLSFFPGKVWPKEHLITASLQTQLEFSENDPRNQLSMRYDDILIDSRKSPYTVVKNLWAIAHIVNHPPPPPIKSATTTMDTVTADQDHLDNDEKKENESNTTTYHFQPHQGPNCVTVPINFAADLFTDESDKLREYIPNEYELPPKSWAKDVFEKEKVIMHGMGLIALRDLKDEELFYDYRMSPNEDAKGSEALYPLWYHVWDVDAAMNRWSKSDE